MFNKVFSDGGARIFTQARTNPSKIPIIHHLLYEIRGALVKKKVIECGEFSPVNVDQGCCVSSSQCSASTAKSFKFI
jgi:hypothetical protein